jgi:glutathione-regulated potassium-efflux system ancillary protein KefC
VAILHIVDAVLLLTAFGLGFLARLVGLPPLVGYLLAGFGLHAAGVEGGDVVERIAHIGVVLMLFGIGLKLHIGTLARPAVWGTATAFAVLGTASTTALLLGLAALGVPLAVDLDVGSSVVIGFAASFCSTVFAVKALERANESASLAGRIAVGVLIVQDLFAVAFLAALGGPPSVWALLVVPGVVALRPVLAWVLDRTGHGETLVVFGVAAAVAVGAGLFELVDLDAGLGALAVGLLLSGHRRAAELAGRLMDLKDLFLVGLFLSIGLTGVPTASAWGVAAVLVALLPLRTAVLLWLFTRFRLRARTALHGALTLSTYSEFGLIVLTATVAEDVLDERWLTGAAVGVSLSFVVASLATRYRHPLFSRFTPRLSALERQPPAVDDAVIDVGDARVLVFGMGRVGTGAYGEIVLRRGPVVLGIDHDDRKVTAHRGRGRNVILGNALDVEFWERVQLHPGIELVLAAMGRHHANVECVRRIRRYLPDVRIAAIATYADQITELQAAGVDVARNLYEEAGQALADDAVTTVYGGPEG